MPEINGFQVVELRRFRAIIWRGMKAIATSFTTWFYLLEFFQLSGFFNFAVVFLGHDMFYFYLASPFVIIRHICLIAILLCGQKKEIELQGKKVPV